MSVFFKTWDAKNLKTYFNGEIENKSVRTWKLDAGLDYVHDTTQFRAAGWFHAVEQSDGLRMDLFIYDSFANKRGFYAEAHGAMVYSMIYHCHHLITGITVTEDPKENDTVF